MNQKPRSMQNSICPKCKKEVYRAHGVWKTSRRVELSNATIMFFDYCKCSEVIPKQSP